MRGDGHHLADRQPVSTASSSPLPQSLERAREPLVVAPVAVSSVLEEYKKRQLEAAKRSMAMKKRRVAL